MLQLAEAEFDYEPYPIGLIRSVFEPSQYASLCSAYPPKDIFEFMPKLGNKYSLSEVNNASAYHHFVATSPQWKAFHAYVKGARFIADVLSFLQVHHIDLGLHRYKAVSQSPAKKRASILSRVLRYEEISARFEFSMMSAEGGHILPHTDARQKLVTLVISMTQGDDWQPNWGGGTDVVLPKDRSLIFNRVNRSLPFDAVEPIKTFEFMPNQCVIFIKTFNSWHSVSPMRGSDASVLRKTLTVNIEAKT